MRRMWAVVAVAALCACDDRAAQGLPPASAADAGTGDDVTHGAHFAVISTNYTGATAVSLLDAHGEVLDDAWLTSATDNPALRTPLAEDVVPPTVSASRRYLTLLERGLGVVTRFDLDAGEVLGQVRADESDGGQSAYRANPQDVAYLPDGSAWISRWAPNPDPDAPEGLRGNDLVRFDPTAMQRKGGRIDLSPLDVRIEQTTRDADGEVLEIREALAAARPTGLVVVGAHLAVGLGRITEDFAYGPGAMAVIDPGSGAITGRVDLSPLRNCGSLRPVPGQPRQLLVACIGDWALLGPESGLALVEVDEDGSAAVVALYAAADHPDVPVAAQNALSLGGTLAIATTGGALDDASAAVTEPDAVHLIDLDAGTQRELLTSAGAFSLGAGAYDALRGLLLIPDAGERTDPATGFHRLRVDGDDVRVDDFVEVAADTGLAARHIHHLVPR